MPVLKSIQVSVDDRDKIFNAIDAREDSPHYDEICGLFEELSKEAEALIKPFAVYELKPNGVRHINGELEACDFVVYGLMSIGGSISKKVTEYFNSGLYLEGMLLDNIADYLVMKCDALLCDTILRDLHLRKLGVTRRFTPAEQIPIEYQSLVARELGADAFGISTTEGHMLNPVKSGSFILGCDSGIPLGDIKHDCSRCALTDCKWRH